MEKWEKEEGASNRGGPFFTLPVFKPRLGFLLGPRRLFLSQLVSPA